MWPFRDAKSKLPTIAVENTIGAGTRVRGDLSGPAGFRIEGTVMGEVAADGPVVVAESGAIEGGIRARDVVVLGTVRGDVRASGHLEIGAKGKIFGDITVDSFHMHKGGVFRGQSHMPSDDENVGEEALGALGEPHVDAAMGDDDEDAAPALGMGEGSSDARGRTLPPKNGAVPPPPTIAELATIAPRLSTPTPLEALSQERLITSTGSTEPEPRRATGS